MKTSHKDDITEMIIVNDRNLEKKTYKGLTTGDIIHVKEQIEGYCSGYGITPKFFLTPDIEAIVIDPETPCVWVKKKGPDTFVCVEFFSPITNAFERVAIYNRKNIIKGD